MAFMIITIVNVVVNAWRMDPGPVPNYLAPLGKANCLHHIIQNQMLAILL